MNFIQTQFGAYTAIKEGKRHWFCVKCAFWNMKPGRISFGSVSDQSQSTGCFKIHNLFFAKIKWFEILDF